MKRRINLRPATQPVEDLIRTVFGEGVKLGPGGLWYVPYMGSRLAFGHDGEFLASGPAKDVKRPTKWGKAEMEFARQEIEAGVALYESLRNNTSRAARTEAMRKRQRAATANFAARARRASVETRRAAAATALAPERNQTVPGWHRSFAQTLQRSRDHMAQQEAQVAFCLRRDGWNHLHPAPGRFGVYVHSLTLAEYSMDVEVDSDGDIINATPVPLAPVPEDDGSIAVATPLLLPRRDRR